MRAVRRAEAEQNTHVLAPQDETSRQSTALRTYVRTRTDDGPPCRLKPPSQQKQQWRMMQYDYLEMQPGHGSIAGSFVTLAGSITSLIAHPVSLLVPLQTVLLGVVAPGPAFSVMRC